jgi:hypothetical protein
MAPRFIEVAMPLQIERDSGIRLLPRSRQNRDTLLLRYRTGRDWVARDPIYACVRHIVAACHGVRFAAR